MNGDFQNMQGMQAQGPGMGSMLAFAVVYFAVMLGFQALMWWKVFEKAGKPGWASIVPVYNIITLLQVAGKPVWLVALFFVPFVNFVAVPVVLILTGLGIAEKFGMSSGFGLGLAFLGPIFYPMIGFGSAQYQGSTGQAMARAA